MFLYIFGIFISVLQFLAGDGSCASIMSSRTAFNQAVLTYSIHRELMQLHSTMPRPSSAPPFVGRPSDNRRTSEQTVPGKPVLDHMLDAEQSATARRCTQDILRTYGLYDKKPTGDPGDHVHHRHSQSWTIHEDSLQKSSGGFAAEYACPELNTRLILNHKGFATPPPELVEFVNLRHLDLSYNGMLNIKHLEGLSELLGLELACNSLSTLKPDAFRFNGKLRCLNLSHNKLTRIEKGSLGHLACLEKLNLGHNKLRCFGYSLTVQGRRDLRASAPDEEGASASRQQGRDGATRTTTRYALEDSSSFADSSSDRQFFRLRTVVPRGVLPPDADTSMMPDAEPETEDANGLRYTTKAPTSTTRSLEDDQDSLFLELLQLKNLTNLDLSWNEFDGVSWEDVVGFFQDLQEGGGGVQGGRDRDADGKSDGTSHNMSLKQLYFQWNPCLRAMKNYRRHMVYALPGLLFLDEAPVKEVFGGRRAGNANDLRTK